MSWDIVLFNSKQKIKAIEEIEENSLEPTDFTKILESAFSEIVKRDNHREIKGKDFAIDFFTDEEPVSNKMISLYGENALFELIELSKKRGWQIFDCGLGDMIDLENPEKNGFENHKKYVSHVIGKLKD